MMMGIGTPRSQSRIPRPMGLSFQPTFLVPIAGGRVLFPPGQRASLRIESSTESTQNRSDRRSATCSLGPGKLADPWAAWPSVWRARQLAHDLLAVGIHSVEALSQDP